MNVLLTGAFSYSKENIKALKKIGLRTDFLQQEKDIVISAEEYDAVVCNGLFLYNDINKFKNLKYIQLTSAGMDRVPLDYIKEHNIKINNARGVYSIPMAEWAVLKVLELYKCSRSFYENQKKHEWVKNRKIFELYGKTVAIIGCGSIGLEVAKRFRAFGVNIIGVDIVKSNSEYIDEYSDINDLDKTLERSDIVVLTMPLTEKTYHLFDEQRFLHMKPTSILVNISRGNIVCEKDLIQALKKSIIYGAAIDVFEEEPLNENSDLWDMDNVIVTPHNSFVGDGNSERMFNVIYENLMDWIEDNE